MSKIKAGLARRGGSARGIVLQKSKRHEPQIDIRVAPRPQKNAFASFDAKNAPNLHQSELLRQKQYERHSEGSLLNDAAELDS